MLSSVSSADDVCCGSVSAGVVSTGACVCVVSAAVVWVAWLVGVGVLAEVGASVGVGVEVGLDVGVGVDVGFSVGVGVIVGVGDGDGVDVGFAVGVGVTDGLMMPVIAAIRVLKL